MHSAASVYPSVHTSLSAVTFEPFFDVDLLHVYGTVMVTAHLGLNVKIKGQNTVGVNPEYGLL